MKRVRRTLVVVALLVFPAALFLVGLRGFVVRNAVVTAELVELRAPIAGIVSDLTLRRGHYEAAGITALRLEDPRLDRRAAEALALSLARTEAAIAAQGHDIAALDQQIAALDGKLEEALSGLRADLALQQEKALAERGGVEASIAFLTKQSERARRLQGSAASQASLEAAEADLAAAQSELSALDLTIERLAQQQGYLDRGLVITELTDDAIALSNSRRALAARRQAGQLELALLQSTLLQERAELESQQRHIAAVGGATLELPPDSVVWEIFVASGASVVPGTPLLSYVACAGRFVEAAVDDSTVDLLDPDHPVEVTLYGTDEPLAGRVTAIYGSAGRLTHQRTLAAHVTDLGGSDAVALIEIADPPLEARESRLCDVGRTAYVTFDGIGLLDPLLNRLF